MIVSVDFERGVVVVDRESATTEYALTSGEAFDAVSSAWIRAGWDAKYVYSFTWMGRPIIQLPDDMIRIQELLYELQPDVILETGVAHGGSLIYYASLCKAWEKGRVIGIDVEIRPQNREALESHLLYPFIDLIEGSSVDPQVLAQASTQIGPDESVVVILDSNHTRDHVLEELRAYAPFVTPGSFIVATDGIMENVVGAPRTGEDWTWNNPNEAVRIFLEENDQFELVEPEFPFNEGAVTNRVTYWPNCYLRRR